MQWRSIPVPIVEVPYQKCLLSVRCPFSVGDISIICHVEAVLLETSRELFQAAFCVIDRLDPILGFAESMFKGVFEGREPRVELDDTYDNQSAESERRGSRQGVEPLPVPSGATLSLAGSAKTEFSESWLSDMVS